jgi:hypothetical protein
VLVVDVLAVNRAVVNRVAVFVGRGERGSEIGIHF